MKAYIISITKLGLLALITVIHAGCSTFATTNEPLTNEPLTNEPSPTKKAQFKIDIDRGDKEKTLVILALSGGGSRAASLSSRVMLELEKVFSDEGLNILKEVDAMSSVSGGSLPAAYYAVSQDRGNEATESISGRYWDDETVNDLMGNNYILRWFGNWFWPDNAVKYWVTSYDRSDIMAQTFADSLYDRKYSGIDLTFADINPDRPYLIINSTNGTNGSFSEIFTFTSDDFTEFAGSDIYQYEISRAVMASASFPAVFNFMSLNDYSSGRDDHYIHVFDGGNADNLGLRSASRIIDENPQYDRVVVILVDAYTPSQGVSRDEPDARGVFSFIVDLNFIDSSNSLLEINRDNIVNEFKSKLSAMDDKKTLFYHVRIEDVGPKSLRNKLTSIATDFKIEDEDAKAIERAMKKLIVKQNTCLQKIRSILLEGETNSQSGIYCTWKK